MNVPGKAEKRARLKALQKIVNFRGDDEIDDVEAELRALLGCSIEAEQLPEDTLKRKEVGGRNRKESGGSNRGE